jgi:hypothetical protein
MQHRNLRIGLTRYPANNEVIVLGAQSAVIGVADDFAHVSPLRPMIRSSTVLITLLGEPLPLRLMELAIVSAVQPYCSNKLIKIPASRATTSLALPTL